jgi:hypothetical protein
VIKEKKGYTTPKRLPTRQFLRQHVYEKIKPSLHGKSEYPSNGGEEIMNLSKWEDLEARVKRLERQNRRLKLGCLVGSLVFACLLTMGEANVGSTVEAKRFVLRSERGEVRAELTTIDGDYPRLTLQSPNGQKEAEVSPLGLSVSDHGLSDKLPLAHYGDTGVYLTDAQGRTVLELGGAGTQSPQSTAAPEIKIFDKKGSQIWHAP